MQKSISIKYYLVLIFVITLFSAETALAGELNLRPPSERIVDGQEFLVSLYYDTGNDLINALEGRISYPDHLIELIDIREGNSVINFWVESPRVSEVGDIVFSGITPGGFRGGELLIFTMRFLAKEVGSGTLNLEDIRAFLNDGSASGASVSTKTLDLAILPAGGDEKQEILIDREPPEDFLPMIGRDDSLYGGKYFLVFHTQDKQSGIKAYYVKEGFFGKYREARSPYLLDSQSLNKRIYVKAVDLAGNERVSVIYPEDVGSPYIMAALWIIIIAGVLMLFYRLKKIKLFK